MVVDLVRPLEVEEVPGTLDHDELRSRRQVVGDRADDVKTHAAVGRTVQVQRGLRGIGLAGGLGRGSGRVFGRRGEHGPVVADGSRQVRLGSERLLHAGGVPRPVITRRPVGPQPVDERMVLHADGELGKGGLEDEDVPAAPELLVGEEPESHRASRRHGHGDHLGPAVWCMGGSRIGEQRPPVVPDDDRIISATERFVQGAGVEGEGPGVVAPIDGNRSGGVAAQKRGDRVVTGIGQPGEKVPPGVGGVREPVEAERQGSVLGAGGQVPELEAVGGDGAEAGDLRRVVVHPGTVARESVRRRD